VLAEGNGPRASIFERVRRATRGGDRALTPALPLGEALHPACLAAVALLAGNDWVLKPHLTGWLPDGLRGAAQVLTGKLSDLAGLACAPVLLSAAIGLVLHVAARLGARVDPSLSRRRLLGCLAATASVTYEPTANNLFFSMRKGDETETEYPLGRFDDVFYAPNEPGLLLLHSPGNTMFRDLKPRETVYVKPDALIYRDISVSTYLTAEYPHAERSIFGSGYQNRNIWLQLSGPGRVAISSKYEKEFVPLRPIVDGTIEIIRW